ncbi:MAG: hypothetical protein ACI9ZT_000965 [Gammaproteobacteria bacterium]|jgi:hypothetical protein
MKIFIANVIVWSFFISQSVFAGNADYTNRHNTTNACELFANDAYQAADNFDDGVVLKDILDLIDGSPVSKGKKHRVFQAIQFVWKNQIGNPVMAYTLAMGICLEPKKEMAPADDPWITSPRTNREYF